MANAFTLFGEITADTSQLQSGLDRVEQRLRQTEAAMGATEKAGSDLGVSSATTARTFEKVNSVLAEQQRRLDAATDAYTAGDISAKQFATILSQVDRAVASANNKVKDTAARFEDYATAAAKAEAANKSFASSASSAADNANKVGSKLEAAGGAMESIGGRLTAAVSVPIAAAGAGILSAGIEYEKGMNYFGAVTNATADQMAKAAQVAQQLGADTQLPATSAKDAALAMVELGKAGMDADQAMESARGTLLLAAAGQLSEAQAAEITANALNTFSLAAGESARVSDLLAAAANASSADVTDVAQSMQQAGVVFAQSGVPIEDLTTAIGLMANAGIKGSDAGTSLKTFLQRLKAPTDAAAASLQQLGVDVYDASGNMKSLPTLLGEFDKGLAGLTDKDKAQALTNIFGADAIRAAEVLFKNGKAGFEQMKTSVTQVGAASKLAAAMTAGVGGRWDALTSQLESIGIKMYEAIKEPLNNLLEFGAGLLEGLGSVFDSLGSGGQILVIALGAVAAILPPILVIVGMLVTAIGTALPVITAMGAAITAAGGGIAGAFGAASAAAGTFGAAVSTALAPILPVIGAVVLAIAAAVAIGYVLYKAYDTNFAGIKDIVDGAIGAVVDTFNNAKAVLMQFWADNGDKIKDAGARIMEFGRRVLEFLEPVIKFFVNNLAAGFTLIWNVVKAVFSAVWSIISGVFMTIVNLIRGDWAGAWDSFKSIFSGVWDSVKSILAALWDYFKTIFANIVNFLSEVGTSIWNKIKEIGSNLIDGFINAIKNGFSAVTGVMSQFGELITNTIKNFLGISSPSKVFAGIGKDSVQGFIDGVNVLKAGANSAVAGLLDVKTLGVVLKGKLGEALLGFITPLVQELTELKNATKEQELDKLLITFGKLSPAMQKMVDAIRPFVKEFDSIKAKEKETEEATKKAEERFRELSGVIIDLIPELKNVPTSYDQLKAALSDTEFLEKLSKETGKTVEELKRLIQIQSMILPTVPIDLSKIEVNPQLPNKKKTEDKTGLSKEQWDKIPAIDTTGSFDIWTQLKITFSDYADTVSERLTKIREDIGTFSTAAADATITFVQGIGNVFVDAISKWDGTFSGFFKSLASGFKSLVSQVLQELTRMLVMQAVMQIFGSMFGSLAKGNPTSFFGKLAAGFGNPVKKAAGGLIRGSGSGTSDSIPAMLSNGEYVMPAASVRKYGASFFESLRSLAAPSPAFAYAGMGGNTNNATTFNNSFNINVGGGSGDSRQTASMIQSEVIKGLQKQQRRNR